MFVFQVKSVSAFLCWLVLGVVVSQPVAEGEDILIHEVCLDDGTFFALYKGSRNFDEAEKICFDQHEGTVGRISSESEFNLIKGLFPSFANDQTFNCLIGIKREEEVFIYSDGTKQNLSFIQGSKGAFPWLPNEPVDTGDCVVFDRFKEFEDQDEPITGFRTAECSETTNFLCRADCSDTFPTTAPSATPNFTATEAPSTAPSFFPTKAPSGTPSFFPTVAPSPEGQDSGGSLSITPLRSVFLGVIGLFLMGISVATAIISRERRKVESLQHQKDEIAAETMDVSSEAA